VDGKSHAYSPIPLARTRSIPAARQLREGEGKRREGKRRRGGKERREEKRNGSGGTWNPAASPAASSSHSSPFRSTNSRLLLRLHGLHLFVPTTSAPSASGV
jgi:hypothetical protein